MVYTPKGTGSCISIDNFIFGENCFLFDKYTDLIVTHWMPLPSPPKMSPSRSYSHEIPQTKTCQKSQTRPAQLSAQA
ncbi:DUF551 domain-containing protein [Moraxella nasibovis]|uniref:DUF551 domain-containing protein n=1 Tax=Moraxella nasibovis TaxID=2904120 RepID=UPI00351F3CDE